MIILWLCWLKELLSPLNKWMELINEQKKLNAIKNKLITQKETKYCTKGVKEIKSKETLTSKNTMEPELENIFCLRQSSTSFDWFQCHLICIIPFPIPHFSIVCRYAFSFWGAARGGGSCLNSSIFRKMPIYSCLGRLCRHCTNNNDGGTLNGSEEGHPSMTR